MTEENVHKIIECIKKADYLENTIFISFCWNNLVYARNYDANINVQFLSGSYDKKLITKLIDNRFDFDVHYPAVDKKLVDTLHENGLKINCWTVDSVKDAQKLIKLGVDFITSNILE